MKPLSNSELGEIRSLYEQVQSSQEVIEEELVYEICEELVEELIEEGYSEEEAIEIVDEATDLYIDEAKVTFGSDTAPMRKSGAAVGARRRFARRKAGEALSGAKKAAGGAYKTAKAKAAGAAVDASLAASAAKKKAGEVKKAVSDAPTKVARAAARGTEKVEKKVKSGIKGLIGRAAKKVASKASAVASRMSEGYDEPKMHSAVKRVMTTQPAAKGRAASRLHSKYSMRSKGNVAGETDGPGPNAPKRSGRKGRGSETDRGSGNAAKRRMSEEIEALKESGLFSDKEIEAFISKEGNIAEMGNPSFDIRGGDPRKAAKTQKINKAADAGVPNAAGKAKGPILPGGLRGV